MKKKFKVGDIINLKKEHGTEIADRFQEITALESQIDAMSKRINKLRDVSWQFIYDLYPGIKDYNLSFNHKEKHILIKSKLEK